MSAGWWDLLVGVVGAAAVWVFGVYFGVWLERRRWRDRDAFAGAATLVEVPVPAADHDVVVGIELPWRVVLIGSTWSDAERHRCYFASNRAVLVGSVHGAEQTLHGQHIGDVYLTSDARRQTDPHLWGWLKHHQAQASPQGKVFEISEGGHVSEIVGGYDRV